MVINIQKFNYCMLKRENPYEIFWFCNYGSQRYVAIGPWNQLARGFHPPRWRRKIFFLQKDGLINIVIWSEIFVIILNNDHLNNNSHAWLPSSIRINPKIETNLRRWSFCIQPLRRPAKNWPCALVTPPRQFAKNAGIKN